MADSTQPNNPFKALLKIVIVGLCLLGIYYYTQWRYPPQHWEDIQASGGMQIGIPLHRDTRLLLPVKYDITGREFVTCEPTRKEVPLMIEELKAHLDGGNVIINIIGSQSTLTAAHTDIHYANLNGIPVGTYDVYYETGGDPSKLLGKVTIQ